MESALLDCDGVEDAAALAEKKRRQRFADGVCSWPRLNKTGLLQKLHGKLTEHELPKRIIFYGRPAEKRKRQNGQKKAKPNIGIL